MTHASPIIPGRGRRRVGAVLLAVGGLLTVLFGVSAKWWFGYGTESGLADIGDGTLYTTSIEADTWSRPLIGWCGGVNETYTTGGMRETWTWTWWAWGTRPNSWDSGMAYTVWPLAPLFVVTGSAVFWPGFLAARRLRRNQCTRCAYSRTGLGPKDVCPECGQHPLDA